MSFIPSGDLFEPTDSLQPSAQPKALLFKQFKQPFLWVLQHQPITGFWLRKGLTQITIRSHFETRLARDWQCLEQARQPLSVLLCEIDGFTQFRRQQGDRACNDYLGQVVKVIYAHIERSQDMLARYQGDTLAILLPYTSLDEAACVAKKIRLRVKALKVNPQLDPSTPAQTMTLSLGIAALVPTSNLAPANLVAAAEQSLRQAQTAGGNRVVLQEGGR
ncbi:MAG: diguanylate cyclase [Acaryochloris sp. RU_4_1]|nr:diguanylate cyclase [Acaryochloris sp. RU_4_1]NJN37467.1 diguanylate cyclase [Acaryochloridaceae cyanobacterium CSU_3_4]NJR54208.1 diguanylate cyclase [Acaryochloris sp. CRU_2_0]